MSLYKVDGHLFSVDEFHTWAMGFVVLYRKGWMTKKKLPREIHDLMKEPDDKLAARELMSYLKSNEDFMPKLIKLVQEGATELAIEKEKS